MVTQERQTALRSAERSRGSAAGQALVKPVPRRHAPAACRGQPKRQGEREVTKDKAFWSDHPQQDRS